MIADEAEPDPEKVHLTARVPVDAPADVVRDEARKGYDLLFIGLENSVEEDGNFAAGNRPSLRRALTGPLALFVRCRRQSAAATDRPQPAFCCRSTARRPSRRAAEIAFALARATGARVRVLFVSQTDGRSRTRLRRRRRAQRHDASWANAMTCR